MEAGCSFFISGGENGGKNIKPGTGLTFKSGPGPGVEIEFKTYTFTKQNLVLALHKNTMKYSYASTQQKACLKMHT